MTKKIWMVIKEMVRTAYAFGTGAFVYYVLWDCTSWFCCDMWWPFALFTLGTYWAVMAGRNKMKEELIKKVVDEWTPQLIELMKRAIEAEENRDKES